MTDRRSPFQGRQPTSRHRSPSPDDHQYRYDSVNRGYPGGSSRTRPRPSRTGSNGSTASHTTSQSYVDGERGSSTRSKSGRNTLKKVPRRDSLNIDPASGSQTGQYYEEEDTVGYFPKLNQIREGKGRRRSSSQASSTVSSTIEPRTRRRRRGADHALDRSEAQYNQRMGQPHAPSPPSMASSAPPEVARESNTSHESGTTVTQATYDEGSDTEDSGSEPETFISEVPSTAVTDNPAGQSNVFQFMHQTPTIEEYSDEEEHHNRPPSTRASSDESSEDGSEHDGEHSSTGGSSHPVRETPTTSPASMRMSRSEASQHGSSKHRIPRKPLYASSFVHGHGGHAEEEAEESEVGSEEESDEGEEEYHHEEVHNVNQRPRQDSAMTKVQPPRVPSTSSGHSDEHTRRLRQREQELANHVLQSPQPQKDFQFAGGPSPHPQPTMPLYSPQAYSGASSASFEATAGYHAEWPQFPPPLPIGYPTQPSLESPNGGHALPLAVQPPMAVPSAPGQPHGPPFQQYPGQPPQYQAHVPAPDMTRTTAAGYELLANKLSEAPKKSNNSLARKGAGNLVPMYRKFEHLNHRVLLHLQDEVCEMEEELRYLDESIAQMSPRDDAGHAYPSSRRSDARYGGELQYKRTELLGRIFQKLGQYNQALTSFNGLVKELDPAGADDIQAYRTWLEKRAPIDFTETRFLERKNDLLAVSRPGSVSATRSSQHQSAVVWLPAMLVLPLLAFVIVPSVLGRLVVIALIGGAGFRQVTLTPELLAYMTVQEWSIAASVYFGFMALLAGLVR